MQWLEWSCDTIIALTRIHQHWHNFFRAYQHYLETLSIRVNQYPVGINNNSHKKEHLMRPSERSSDAFIRFLLQLMMTQAKNSEWWTNFSSYRSAVVTLTQLPWPCSGTQPRDKNCWCTLTAQLQRRQHSFFFILPSFFFFWKRILFPRSMLLHGKLNIFVFSTQCGAQ